MSLQISNSHLQTLAVLHSLLVYQSLNGVYSDVYQWSLADLGFAVDQLQAVGCDLQSADNATQILTHVYAARCHGERDAEKIHEFISRLIRTLATGVDVIIQSFVVCCGLLWNCFHLVQSQCIWYGNGADNTTKVNSSIFSLIQMH